jgi:hypothetical protein
MSRATENLWRRRCTYTSHLTEFLTVERIYTCRYIIFIRDTKSKFIEENYILMFMKSIFSVGRDEGVKYTLVYIYPGGKNILVYLYPPKTAFLSGG